jgi:hypothetical protein
MSGDFELMSDLPVHQGEGSLSMSDANLDGVALQPHDSRTVSSYNKKVTIITAIIATASLFAALLAMWWCASQVAYLAFIFPLVTAPAVVVQRIRIQWLPSMFFLVVRRYPTIDLTTPAHLYLYFVFVCVRVRVCVAFREEHNKLRAKVNEFAYQNARLQAENGRLGQQAHRYVVIFRGEQDPTNEYTDSG